jgi:hypothetical protein
MGVYSLSGIHPQCAVQQQDILFKAAQKAEQRAAVAAAEENTAV